MVGDIGLAEDLGADPTLGAPAAEAQPSAALGDEIGDDLLSLSSPAVTRCSPRRRIFNEGYTATAGGDWVRPALCQDALRLGRILAELVPREAEVHGLTALMELQASRLGARTGPAGEPVTLPNQDRSRWDFLLIGRGLRALDRAEALGGDRGPYALQAAIAACHARARTPQETDWPRIASLYDELTDVVPSPIIELNRGVALGHGLRARGRPRARRRPRRDRRAERPRARTS